MGLDMMSTCRDPMQMGQIETLVIVVGGLVAIVAQAQTWLKAYRERQARKREGPISSGSRDVASRLSTSPLGGVRTPPVTRREYSSDRSQPLVVRGFAKASIHREGAGFFSRWVGPWLWAVVQTYILVFGWWIFVDFEGYLNWAVEGTQWTRDQLVNAPGNFLFYSEVAALLSLAFSRSDRRRVEDFFPRDFRGRIYATYVLLDIATGLALAVRRHETIFQSFHQRSGVGGWLGGSLVGWLVAGGLLLLAVVVLKKRGVI